MSGARGSRGGGLEDLKQLIRKVERSLNAKIARLQGELQASELALAAAKLRALNEEQAQDGTARLRAELKTLHELGIVDRSGRRVRKDWPVERLEGASEVV